jgi:hypothetical protein
MCDEVTAFGFLLTILCESPFSSRRQGIQRRIDWELYFLLRDQIRLPLLIQTGSKAAIRVD